MSSSFPLNLPLAGHGLGPSSSGDSLPAFALTAHGPSVSFAPSVSVCKASPVVSHPAPEMFPALGMAPSLPDKSSALLAATVKVRPPAKPPPSAFLRLLDLSLSPSPVTPTGLLMHTLVHDGPASQSSLFNHLTVGQDVTAPALLTDSFLAPRSFSSVYRVVTCPKVLGFRGNGWSHARINLTAMSTAASPDHLIDGGANICIIGDIDSLFDVVEIPPLPISVAVEGDFSIDDCCTAHGWIPLQLDDGSIYWQVCYYCKNAVEMIISPQAIVNSSDVFQSWHQTGYRHGASTPGYIRFDSHDGLLSMRMTLVLHDRLHYYPTNVYAVDSMPALRYLPMVWRATGSVSLPGLAPELRRSRSHERFFPVSKAKQVESEVWLLCLGSPGVRQLDLLPGRVTGIPSDFRYHPFHFLDHKEHASIKK